jgi:uncharacterized protein YuzE
LASMVVEYDTEAGAFYVRVTDHEVALTVEISTFVSVDVDSDDHLVGLELLCLPSAVSVEERSGLRLGSPWPSMR